MSARPGEMRTDQLLQRLELSVCLGEKLLLVLAPSQSPQRLIFSTGCQRVLGGLTLALEDMLSLANQPGDTQAADLALVLLELVALQLQAARSVASSGRRALEDGAVLRADRGGLRPALGSAHAATRLAIERRW